jgi:hypothetical protein
MPTAANVAPNPVRSSRPLYLKKVPTPIWERVHVNAIKSGMRLGDYLVSILAASEPINGADPPPPESTLPTTSLPASGNV